RPVAVADSWIVPEFRVEATATVTTPFTGETEPVGVAVASDGVTLVMVTDGVLALATVVPFESLRVTYAVVLPFPVPPFATTVAGDAVQTSCVAGPNTVTLALPVDPEAEATTEHGCEA